MMDVSRYQLQVDVPTDPALVDRLGRVAPIAPPPDDPEFLGWCLDCNYPLHHLGENRCPECGRPFDPANKRTRNTEEPINSVGRFLLKPVGWSLPALSFLYLLACCWETRVPSTVLKFPFVSKYLGAVVWMAWMTRMMGRLAFRMRYQETDLVKKGGWGFAWTVPIIIAAAYVMVGAEVPLMLGVWVSQGQMEQFSKQVMATPTAPHPDQWVGVYYTQGASVLAAPYHGAKFGVRIAGAPFAQRHGFAYAPDQVLPAETGDGSFEHLTGAWYVWTEK